MINCKLINFHTYVSGKTLSHLRHNAWELYIGHPSLLRIVLHSFHGVHIKSRYKFTTKQDYRKEVHQKANNIIKSKIEIGNVVRSFFLGRFRLLSIIN